MKIKRLQQKLYYKKKFFSQVLSQSRRFQLLKQRPNQKKLAIIKSFHFSLSFLLDFKRFFFDQLVRHYHQQFLWFDNSQQFTVVLSSISTKLRGFFPRDCYPKLFLLIILQVFIHSFLLRFRDFSLILELFFRGFYKAEKLSTSTIIWFLLLFKAKKCFSIKAQRIFCDQKQIIHSFLAQPTRLKCRAYQ